LRFDPLFDRKTVSGPGQQDGRLDPGDAYDSPWVGTPSHGEAITVGGQGIPVIGIHGRRAAVIDALGLVLSSP
jgi:hypothetical protein